MKYQILASALFLSVNAYANPVCENPGISDSDGDGWGWENGTSCRVVNSGGGSATETANESDVLAQLRALTNRVAELERKVNGSNTQQPTYAGGYSNQTPGCRTAIERINANALQLHRKTQAQVQALIGKPNTIESSTSNGTVTVVWNYSNNGTWSTPRVTFRNNNVTSFDSDFYNSYCS